MTQEMKDIFKEIGKLFLKMADQLEKYEEKEVDEDGFIKWEGGVNPVPNTEVVVRFRDVGYNDVYANSDNFYWEHFGGQDDIIAYKISKA